MKRFVVYTVMVGKYGEIYQPLYIDDRFDYVLFSNDYTEQYVGVWKVLPIPFPPEIEKSDKKRLSRYPKTHPETMLSNYEASLYIDANIQIVDRWVYDRCVELANQKINYAGIRLLVTGRDCIYRHAYDMCILRAENDCNAMQELHALRKEGFPEHYGLNENNIIFRRHNNLMQEVDSLWWKWIVNYSFRDQFSYMFCLWKYKIQLEYFLPIGEDSHNSCHFSYYFHSNESYVAKQKWVKLSTIELFRNKCRLLSKFHRKYYEWEWLFISKCKYYKIALSVLGILSVVLNAPLLIMREVYNYIRHKKNLIK